MGRIYFDFFVGALVFVDFFAGAVFSVAFAAFLAVAILELLKQGLPKVVTKSSGKPCKEELAWAAIQPTYAQFRQANLIVLNNLSIRQEEQGGGADVFGPLVTACYPPRADLGPKLA